MSNKENWNNTDFNDLEGEIWKSIDGFPDYEVSSLGRVKSLRRKIILKQSFDRDGYCKVDLNGKTRRVSRLVALNFIHNDDVENKVQVNHLNEIITDNRIENLEWISIKDNNNYGTHVKRIIETKRRNGPTEKETNARRRNLEKAYEASRATNYEGSKKTLDRVRHLGAKAVMKRVYCEETGLIYESIKQASDCTGKEVTRIGKCCNGKCEHTGGYHFRFYDKNEL